MGLNESAYFLALPVLHQVFLSEEPFLLFQHLIENGREDCIDEYMPKIISMNSQLIRQDLKK